MPPSDPRHLVVRAASDGDLELSLRHITEARLDLLWTQTAGQVGLNVRSPAGDVPQSLGFVLDQDGLRRCRDYLGRLDIAGVTLAGVAAMPAIIVDLLSSLQAPVTVSATSRACLARFEAKPDASASILAGPAGHSDPRPLDFCRGGCHGPRGPECRPASKAAAAAIAAAPGQAVLRASQPRTHRTAGPPRGGPSCSGVWRGRSSRPGRRGSWCSGAASTIWR